jgi:hypothetical protein
MTPASRAAPGGRSTSDVSADVNQPWRSARTHEIDEPLYIEPRWPLALVVSAFIVLTIVLRVVEPQDES